MGRPSTPHRLNDPLPLSQVVLKLHSRCDLACDHCYVYEAADQSWRGRPAVISDEVISQVGQRLAEHAALPVAARDAGCHAWRGTVARWPQPGCAGS